jgi:peptidoglycan/xylan/chitin deacetylase (PgdA/CDA1 family)
MRRGVPVLQDILRRCDINASFFIPTGGESSIFELAKFSGGGKAMAAGVSLPKHELARMVAFPKNYFLENIQALKDMQAHGHTVGVHGFKHRAWTRGLDRIDVLEQVSLATQQYMKSMGRPPVSFAAPGFMANSSVLTALDSCGYRAAGDLDYPEAFYPVVNGVSFKCAQVPVTLKAPTTQPLFEYYCQKGLSDSQVVKQICSDIDRLAGSEKLATLYCHDYFEGTLKPLLVDEVLSHVKKQGYQTATIEEIARSCKKSVRISL